MPIGTVKPIAPEEWVESGFAKQQRVQSWYFLLEWDLPLRRCSTPY
jgi:hypothetical protein